MLEENTSEISRKNSLALSQRSEIGVKKHFSNNDVIKHVAGEPPERFYYSSIPAKERKDEDQNEGAEDYKKIKRKRKKNKILVQSQDLKCSICRKIEFETEPIRETIFCYKTCRGLMIHLDCAQKFFVGEEGKRYESISYRCNECNRTIKLDKDKIVNYGTEASSNNSQGREVDPSAANGNDDDSVKSVGRRFYEGIAIGLGVSWHTFLCVLSLLEFFIVKYIFLGYLFKAVLLGFQYRKALWSDPWVFFVSKKFIFEHFYDGVKVPYYFLEIGMHHAIYCLAGHVLVWMLRKVPSRLMSTVMNTSSRLLQSSLLVQGIKRLSNAIKSNKKNNDHNNHNDKRKKGKK